MRILIIEDEYNLADVMQDSLKSENYEVDIKTDGEEGLYNALSNTYDLIILDVMLPKINGFDILRKLREDNIDSKIIMLTAKSSLEDKLNGLEHGANDYITKPFHIEELIARVNIQLKGSMNLNKKDIISYGDLELNIHNSKLKCIKTGEELELVCKEFLLLEYLINNSCQILSKQQIYDKVWGFENEIESNNLEVYLSFLRKKLRVMGSSVNIKSIRGLGYRLEYQND